MTENSSEKHKAKRAWRWVNPYIPRLTEFPALVLGTAEDGMTPEERAYFDKRVSAARQVVCELGSGSGGFLIEHALRQPETLFIGFELRFKRVIRTAEKAAKNGLSNLLVAKLRAQEIGSLFPAGSLAGVHVNFPDPWAKRRWTKHRLLSPEFLKTIVQKLSPGGFFSYKTDHAACFEETYAELLTLPEIEIVEVTRELQENSGEPVDNIPTEFEKLFRSKGIAIHYVRALKRPICL